MKKILLIDDRPDRQKSLLGSSNASILEYEETNLDNVKKIEGDERYNNLKAEILSNNFSSLNEYLVIIVHRSAFEDRTDEVIEKLKTFCSKNNKNLVLFSGGISSSFYTENPHRILLINSKLFYSHNLELFLENISKSNIDTAEKVKLLLLAYGNNWKKNLLLNCLEKINYFELTQDITTSDFDDLDTFTDVKLIKEIIDFIEPDNKDLAEFISDIKIKILQKVAYDG